MPRPKDCWHQSERTARVCVKVRTSSLLYRPDYTQLLDRVLMLQVRPAFSQCSPGMCLGIHVYTRTQVQICRSTLPPCQSAQAPICSSTVFKVLTCYDFAGTNRHYRLTNCDSRALAHILFRWAAANGRGEHLHLLATNCDSMLSSGWQSIAG